MSVEFGAARVPKCSIPGCWLPLSSWYIESGQRLAAHPRRWMHSSCFCTSGGGGVGQGGEKRWVASRRKPGDDVLYTMRKYADQGRRQEALELVLRAIREFELGAESMPRVVTFVGQKLSCSAARMAMAEAERVRRFHPNMYREFFRLCEKFKNAKEAELVAVALLRTNPEGRNPPVRVLRSALQATSRLGQPLVVERILQFWRKCNYAMDEDTFIRLCEAYGRRGDVDAVNRVTEQMRREQIPLGDRHRRAVMTAFARVGDIDSTEATFTALEKPDPVAFSILIRMYTVKGNVQMVNETFQRMLKARVTLESHVVVDTLEMLLRREMWSDAGKIIEVADARELQPTRSLLTQYLRYYTAVGDKASVERTIKRSPYLCEWDDPRFANAAMQSRARLGDSDGAAALFYELGRKADHYSYCILLESFAKGGKIGQCIELIHRMRRMGVRSNRFCYTQVLKACRFAPPPPRPEHSTTAVLQLMDEDRVPPDAGLLCAAALALHHERQPQAVWTLFRLLDEHVALQVNEDTSRFCKSVVRLIGASGNPKDVLRVIRAYERRGLASNAALLQALRTVEQQGTNMELAMRFAQVRGIAAGARTPQQIVPSSAGPSPVSQRDAY